MGAPMAVGQGCMGLHGVSVPELHNRLPIHHVIPAKAGRWSHA